MNRLELARRVAQETGTIDGEAVPATTTGQVGRLADIVRWTDQAYVDVLLAEDGWPFLRSTFEVQTIAGTRAYTAASWSLADFDRWMPDYDRRRCRHTIYKTADGAANEGELTYMDWLDFEQVYMRGVVANNQPAFYSINDADEFVLGPTPDDAYTVRGPYRIFPAAWTSDTDEPIFDRQFHMVIVYRALIKCGLFDEASAQVAGASSEYNLLMDRMRRRYGPRLTRVKALA